MKQLDRMTVDELWSLHEVISEVLTERLAAEKLALEKRLTQLRGQPHSTRHQNPVGRRPYPPVHPKFRNPDDPSETWAGRGRQPRWVAEQLSSGKKMEDFKIQPDRTFKEKQP